MAEVVVERTLRCVSTRQAMWPFVSDTEEINRAVGLNPIDAVAHSSDGAARFVVRTKSAGFPLEYEELPFEWAENRFFRILRVVRDGAAEYLDNRFELSELEGNEPGCNLHIRLVVKPRYRLLTPIIRFQVNGFADRIMAEFSRIDNDLAAAREPAFTQAEPTLHRDALTRRSQRLLTAIDADRRPVVDKLIDWLANARDSDVARIRPLQLAAQWGEPGRTVLAVCLTAVDTGLLDMRWDLVCPSCQTAADHVATLAELTESGHCQLCDIDFGVDFDLAVEATFRPAAALRAVDNGPYCIGGPAHTPHVVAQAILPARGQVRLQAPEVAGRYRLFVRGGFKVDLTVAADGAAELEVDASSDAPAQAPAELRPDALITVSQRDAQERHVKVEQIEWRAAAATARLISTLPEFRRRFSHDLLRPGMALNVGHLALMFTDMTASTALYRRVGDASAFAVVDAHFELCATTVDQNGGAVVKTMGDAVMAVFTNLPDAIAAACSLHRQMPPFRRAHPDANECKLKIGVFAGPCYAVTANGIVDYFGQTVNTAARLQALAGGGELILVAEAMKLAQQQGWLAPALKVDRFETHLKGVGDTHVARVTLDDA